MSNGKSKGSAWERDVSKYLTFWLTGQSEEYYFWRSPQSGGIASISPVNKDLHGDIIPLKSEADILCSKFVIEAKNGYPKTSLDLHLKYNKKDNMQDFWKQVSDGSKSINKYPMLIYKKKGMPIPWLGICNEIYSKWKKHLSEKRFIHLKWENDLPDLYFFGLYEFFEVITPEIVKKTRSKK